MVRADDEGHQLSFANSESLLSFVSEYVRNRLVSTVPVTVVVDGDLHAVLQSTLEPLLPRSRGRLLSAEEFLSASSQRPADLYVQQGSEARLSGFEVLRLPGATAARDKQCKNALHLAVGNSAGPVVMIPGISDGHGNLMRSTAQARLHDGLRVARKVQAVAIVLSGWGGWNAATVEQTEAFQMGELLEGWSGPVIYDIAARTTAENLICLRALTVSDPPFTRVHVVASWTNAARIAALGRICWNTDDGVTMRTEVAWGRQHAVSARSGIVGLAWMWRHSNAGRALLRYGPDDPRSRP